MKRISIASINPECLTVGDLKAILAEVDDDAPIIIGADLDHCDDYIASIAIGHTVGFFTTDITKEDA